MSKDAFTIRRHKRVADSYDNSISQLLVVIQKLAPYDLVTKLFLAWLEHAWEIRGDNLRKYSTFDWVVDHNSQVLGSFKVTCKAPDAPGDFIRVGRVHKPEGVVTDELEQIILRQRLADLVNEMVYRKDNYTQVTILVIGSWVTELLNRIESLVSLREDNGLHMLFRDGNSPDVYLEVYLGGAWQYKG